MTKISKGKETATKALKNTVKQLKYQINGNDNKKQP